MGSVRVLGMATVAVLTQLAALAPEASGVSGPSSNPTPETVKCLEDKSPVQVTISAPGSRVVECPQTYTFEPQVTGNAETQQVCDTPKCEKPQLLTRFCPNATLETLSEEGEPPGQALTTEVQVPEEAAKTSRATLTIKTLPVNEKAVFYLQCKPPTVQSSARGDGQKQACVVMVTVEKAPSQEGEAAVVHVCTQPSASISVSVPDKGSSVQFACENQFNLYPRDAKRVFKDDCKTEEDLKDMTRTHAAASAPRAPAPPRSEEQSAASASTIYTLRADKKPSKGRLCYLCASQSIVAPNQGTAKDYCTIYVESSACTQCGLCLALIFMLSCVLAMLPSA